MLKRIGIALVLGLFILSAQAAYCAEFQTIGFRAVSMGGAGVAASNDSYATYYNPALLAKPKHGLEISLGGGIAYREINLIDHIDTLSDIDIDATFTELENAFIGFSESDLDDFINNNLELTLTIPTTHSNVTTIKRELRAIAKGNGVQLMPNMSLAVQAGNIGAGIFSMGEATAFAVVDTDKLDFIYSQSVTVLGVTVTPYIEYDETDGTYGTFKLSSEPEYNASSLEVAIGNSTPESTTYITVTGLSYTEVPVGYGYNINIPTGNLSVGGALKLVYGVTYSAKIDVDSNADTIEDTIEASEKSATTFGLDLGALYSPSAIENLSIGIVGKNLNTPSFDAKIGGDIDIDPQLRAGVAMNLMNNKITLACDLDLTVNETYIDGYDSQFFGGGISYQPFSFLSLRGGMMQNLQENDEGTILTAGFGLGTKWIQFDLAAQYGLKDGEYDDKEIPRYGKVQIAFVSKWN